MATFYLVKTTIIDSSTRAQPLCHMRILPVEADNKPEDRCESDAKKDTYFDYFDTLTEAKEWVEENRE